MCWIFGRPAVASELRRAVLFVRSLDWDFYSGEADGLKSWSNLRRMLFIKHLSSAVIALFGNSSLTLAPRNKTVWVYLDLEASVSGSVLLTPGSSITRGSTLYLTLDLNSLLLTQAWGSLWDRLHRIPIVVVSRIFPLSVPVLATCCRCALKWGWYIRNIIKLSFHFQKPDLERIDCSAA